MADTEDSMF